MVSQDNENSAGVLQVFKTSFKTRLNHMDHAARTPASFEILPADSLVKLIQVIEIIRPGRHQLKC